MLAVVLAGAGVMVSRYADRSERRALDDRLKATAELSRETALASIQQSLPTPNRRLDQVLSATGTSLRLLLAQRVLQPYGRPPTGDRPPPRASPGGLPRRGGTGPRRATACGPSRPGASATGRTSRASSGPTAAASRASR